MKSHKICTVGELPPGERKIVEIEGRSIGVFNVQGHFYAIKNSCPHQFAPLCLGKVTGYNPPSEVGVYQWCREGEIIRCPWHAWEFDLKTGRSVFNPHKVRTKSYAVNVAPSFPSPEDADTAVETFKVDVNEEAVFVLL